MPLTWLPMSKCPQLLSPIPSPPYLSYLANLFTCLLSVPLYTPTPTPQTCQLHDPTYISQPFTVAVSLPWGNPLRIIPGRSFKGWSPGFTLQHRAEESFSHGSSNSSPGQSTHCPHLSGSFDFPWGKWGWGKWDTGWPSPSTHKGHMWSSLGSQVRVPSSELRWGAKHIPTSLAYFRQNHSTAFPWETLLTTLF